MIILRNRLLKDFKDSTQSTLKINRITIVLLYLTKHISLVDVRSLDNELRQARINP